ncbi:glycosyltransferase family 4 protein [Aeromonas bestiarum]|uniref:glycosyltransferase family 4 protein n=1 Tax=Aeromonas bestiarum TaxID=105751 RepID=UPI0023782989|nr:glycosyltransferase family 4 protein [Aeromonas bestiarum]WDL83944.1 glycosyltransferase family 4 protein [Aeromonas bestiarum]
MNVLLMVPSNDNAGPVNVVKYLTKACDGGDVNFTVLCLRKKSDFAFPNCKTVFIPDNISPVFKIFWVLTFFKLNHFNVCHSHGFFPDLYGFICKVIKLDCFKFISTVHNYPDLDYSMEYGKLSGAVLSRIHFFILKRLDLVIGCSSSVSENLHRFSIDSKVVRNGVYVNTIQNLQCPLNNVKLNDYHYTDRRINLLFLGRLIKRKNFADIAKVFINANDEFHKKFQLTVCGDGPELAYYSSKFKDYPNVSFLGHVDNPSDILFESDVLISTSIAEGFPLSVLEAIQVGKKALLSDIKPHLELKEYLGPVIQCYRLKDSNDLYDKIMNEEQSQIIKDSRAIYLSSATRMLGEYEEYYREGE